MKDKTNLAGLNPDNFQSVINGKDTAQWQRYGDVRHELRGHRLIHHGS